MKQMVGMAAMGMNTWHGKAAPEPEAAWNGTGFLSLRVTNGRTDRRGGEGGYRGETFVISCLFFFFIS